MVNMVLLICESILQLTLMLLESLHILYENCEFTSAQDRPPDQSRLTRLHVLKLRLRKVTRLSEIRNPRIHNQRVDPLLTHPRPHPLRIRPHPRHLINQRLHLPLLRQRSRRAIQLLFYLPPPLLYLSHLLMSPKVEGRFRHGIVFERVKCG